MTTTPGGEADEDAIGLVRIFAHKDHNHDVAAGTDPTVVGPAMKREEGTGVAATMLPTTSTSSDRIDD